MPDRNPQRSSSVYLALYGPKGSVIFDHPYADSARWMWTPARHLAVSILPGYGCLLPASRLPGPQGRPAGGDPLVVLRLAAGTAPGCFEYQACSLTAASADAVEPAAGSPHLPCRDI